MKYTEYDDQVARRHKRLDQALAAAERYRQLSTEGRWEEAQQEARAIDELVGSWREGRWIWPHAVRLVAGK